MATRRDPLPLFDQVANRDVTAASLQVSIVAEGAVPVVDKDERLSNTMPPLRTHMMRFPRRSR